MKRAIHPTWYVRGWLSRFAIARRGERHRSLWVRMCERGTYGLSGMSMRAEASA